ncbi:MAG: hypothetical protein HKN75_04755 [Bacteroidia bacterium]|nr:hypothetical protein [Bacteroidia bacterium]
MKNKLTVLGLVAATAFIFTSCTKDTDVTPGSKFAAPTATLEAPALNDGAVTKNGNEYAENDLGQSIPSMETATPSEPTHTPPTSNNTNRIGYWTGVKDVQVPHIDPMPANVGADATRYQEYWMGVKEVSAPSQEPVPADVQANSVRYQEYFTGIKDEPTPAQIPPVMESPNADRTSDMGKNLFPESPVPSEPNVVPHTSMSPAHSSSNAGRISSNSDLPDCTFPVISNQGPGKNIN